MLNVAAALRIGLSMLVLRQVFPRRKPYVFADGRPLLSDVEEGQAVPVIPFQVVQDSKPYALRRNFSPFRHAVPAERGDERYDSDGHEDERRRSSIWRFWLSQGKYRGTARET